MDARARAAVERERERERMRDFHHRRDDDRRRDERRDGAHERLRDEPQDRHRRDAPERRYEESRGGSSRDEPRGVVDRWEPPREDPELPPMRFADRSWGAPSRDPPPNSAKPVKAFPSKEFGYIVPKSVALDPDQDGRVVAIQALAGWEQKPKGTAVGKRTGAGGGFAEFNREAEDERRQWSAHQEKMQVMERKATKQKCSFCHRASCIC